MGNLQQTILHIWNIFVTSNLFNFVIFIAIFAVIFKKIDFQGMLDGAKQKVIAFIDAAKKEKEEASQELEKAQNAVANLDSELNGIIEDAKKSAKVISEKIFNEAEAQIASIESNALKIIGAEEKLLIAKLSKTASKASIELAKAHIGKVLEETPSLYEKYIDESINELDRLKI